MCDSIITLYQYHSVRQTKLKVRYRLLEDIHCQVSVPGSYSHLDCFLGPPALNTRAIAIMPEQRRCESVRVLPQDQFSLDQLPQGQFLCNQFL